MSISITYFKVILGFLCIPQMNTVSRFYCSSSNCNTKSLPGCRNLFNSWPCYIWANQGECLKTEAYMTTVLGPATNVALRPQGGSGLLV